MKKIQLLPVLIIAFTLISTSCKEEPNEQSSKLSLSENKSTELPEESSDGCGGYYPMAEGVSFELTFYDANNKAAGVFKHKIIETKRIDNGIVAFCEMRTSDQEGSPRLEMKYEAKCQNGNYYLNLEGMFSQITSQYKNQGMEVNIENGISVVPNSLAVNDKLDDATMNMKISSAAFNMEMTITIYDRAVIGKETITTPAGTFDCMILSQKTETKTGKMMTVTTSSKEWLSKGVGSVKSENYNKDNKLEGYFLLTKFNK